MKSIKEEFEKYLVNERKKETKKRVKPKNDSPLMEIGTKIIESKESKKRTTNVISSTILRLKIVKQFDSGWKDGQFMNRRDYFQYLVEQGLPDFVENHYRPDPDFSLATQLRNYLMNHKNMRIAEWLIGQLEEENEN